MPLVCTGSRHVLFTGMIWKTTQGWGSPVRVCSGFSQGALHRTKAYNLMEEVDKNKTLLWSHGRRFRIWVYKGSRAIRAIRVYKHPKLEEITPQITCNKLNLPAVQDDQLQSTLNDSFLSFKKKKNQIEDGLRLADDCCSILLHTGLVSARGGTSI